MNRTKLVDANYLLEVRVTIVTNGCAHWVTRLRIGHISAETFTPYFPLHFQFQYYPFILSFETIFSMSHLYNYYYYYITLILFIPFILPGYCGTETWGNPDIYQALQSLWLSDWFMHHGSAKVYIYIYSSGVHECTIEIWYIN